MRRIAATLIALSALAAGTAFGQGGTAQGERPDCVIADGHAQYTGYGYRHYVTVANHCAFAVDCRVFTDVNPDLQRVHVAAAASTDVATFLSSPASTFVAHVDCPHTDVVPVERPE